MFPHLTWLRLVLCAFCLLYRWLVSSLFICLRLSVSVWCASSCTIEILVPAYCRLACGRMFVLASLCPLWLVVFSSGNIYFRITKIRTPPSDLGISYYIRVCVGLLIAVPDTGLLQEMIPCSTFVRNSKCPCGPPGSADAAAGTAATASTSCCWWLLPPVFSSLCLLDSFYSFPRP